MATKFNMDMASANLRELASEYATGWAPCADGGARVFFTSAEGRATSEVFTAREIATGERE